MTEKFETFDPVDYLDSPEQIEAYLLAAKEEGDPEFYRDAQELARLATLRLNSETKLIPLPSFPFHKFSVGSIYNYQINGAFS